MDSVKAIIKNMEESNKKVDKMLQLQRVFLFSERGLTDKELAKFFKLQKEFNNYKRTK